MNARRSSHSLSKTIAKRPKRLGLAVRAFDANPYEPLERAIQIVNRVISIGEKTKWRGDVGGSGSARVSVKKERWVQFGAVTSARVPIAPLSTFEGIQKIEHSSTETEKLLREYLSLPTSEYSLLDPKWVERVERTSDSSDSELDETIASDSFIVKIPLHSIIGVDLTPKLAIVATPMEGQGKVTFVGSKASLGSPGLDESFKLNVTAELQSQDTSRRRLPRIRTPDHIPGRPVSRLQKWAANARSKSLEEDEKIVAEVPFPSETVYLSQDGDDDTQLDHKDDASSEDSSIVESASLNMPPSVFLKCKVNVTIAVKVPTALKVVPNPLLGYAGSLITKTVLNGAIPNFADLLGKDFENWAKNGGQRNEDAVGELFVEMNQYETAG